MSENSFSLLHIDVARNATDDFNLFHDKHRWHEIDNNPFEGPIVLGFQLAALLYEHTLSHRQTHNEFSLITREQLNYTNVQLNFANAVKPDQPVNVAIKKSLFSDNEMNPALSNRVSLHSCGGLCMAGFIKESHAPLFIARTFSNTLPDLRAIKDRSFLPNSNIFLKRKYMNISNAKNFLCSALIEQSRYFDEVADHIAFPALFPCSLISCALLEKAQLEGLNFRKDPLVYTAHKLSINNIALAQLRSNDCLDILVAPDPAGTPYQFECLGIVNKQQRLFEGVVTLKPLF